MIAFTSDSHQILLIRFRILTAITHIQTLQSAEIPNHISMHPKVTRLQCCAIICCILLWCLMTQLLYGKFATSNSCVPLKNTTIGPVTLPELQPLSEKDYHQLIDLEDFEFTLNVASCREHPPIVVAMVYSAASNFQRRKVIRETWGGEDPRALVIFLLAAVGREDYHMQDKIEIEHRVHGDIVQCSFLDGYRNLTYKHVAALKWLVYNCPAARFMFKTDDDVMVNTPLMYNYLEVPLGSNAKLHCKELIFGHIMSCAKVQRSGYSKWRVSIEEYADKHYPNYCLGVFVLYSSDIVRSVYQVAQTLPFFWIEDVHITGTVSSRLGLTITSAEDFYLSKANQKSLLSGRDVATVPPFFFSQPELTENEMRSLWATMSEGDSTAGLL